MIKVLLGLYLLHVVSAVDPCVFFETLTTPTISNYEGSTYYLSNPDSTNTQDITRKISIPIDVQELFPGTEITYACCEFRDSCTNVGSCAFAPGKTECTCSLTEHFDYKTSHEKYSQMTFDPSVHCTHRTPMADFVFKFEHDYMTFAVPRRFSKFEPDPLDQLLANLE